MAHRQFRGKRNKTNNDNKERKEKKRKTLQVRVRNSQLNSALLVTEGKGNITREQQVSQEFV